MKRLFVSLAFVCCSALLTSSLRAEGGYFTITDVEGRETSHVLRQGLGLDLADYTKLIFLTNAKGEAYRDPDGLGLEVDASYWICVPFSLIESGKRVGPKEFAIRLFPGSPVESVRGALAPTREAFPGQDDYAARITGKFELAGMQGDFSLPLEQLAAIAWVGDPPAKEADVALKGRPATLFLKDGKKLEVADVHRYRNRHITERRILWNGTMSSPYYNVTREENIVLVTGENELNIPFEKIGAIAFLDKGVTVQLVDGTKLQFGRVSTKYDDATDAFAARSTLGPVFVKAENVVRIEFGPKAAESNPEKP